MESTDQEMAGLSELHQSLADASEVIAAFISTEKGGEKPPDSLMEAAEKTLSDLTKWRSGLKEALSVADTSRH